MTPPSDATSLYARAVVVYALSFVSAAGVIAAISAVRRINPLDYGIADPTRLAAAVQLGLLIVLPVALAHWQTSKRTVAADPDATEPIDEARGRIDWVLRIPVIVVIPYGFVVGQHIRAWIVLTILLLPIPLLLTYWTSAARGSRQGRGYDH